jgi:Carboxypeptidase regulatory-like domain
VKSPISNQFLFKILSLSILIACQLLGIALSYPVQATTMVSKKADATQPVLSSANKYSPKKLAVGIYLNGHSKSDSMYVWGEGHNSIALDFSQWLLPIDKLTQAMGWQTRKIDHQLEILIGSQVVKVPLVTAPPESGLGDVAAVHSLQAIPGLDINFSPQKYSIDFTVAKTTNNLAASIPKQLPAAIKPESNITQTVQPQTVPQVSSPNKYNPDRLLVGLNINGQSKLLGISILGQENGATAINFDDWLLPFDETAQALGWKITEIDNQLEITAASQRFRLPANKIITNQVVGRAIAARDIAAIIGYTIKFDIFNYAIDITTPGSVDSKFTAAEPPIVLDGLAKVQPPVLGFSIVQQRLNSSGSTRGEFGIPEGELQATGNIGDAGWYLRFNQPTITDPKTWNLSDLVFLRQHKNDDQILGSQSPFWRYRSSTINGTYWAATTVHRNGFDPPVRFSGGDYSLNERLQARRSSRVISGQAEPGTLVQLVRNDRTQLLQELLVDSSGIYRFNNVVVSSNLDDTFIGQEYQVLLYPRGQLTANPTVRDITFTTFSGQIPTGADAFVISAGANRVASGNFGSFDAAQGGVLYRRGLTDSLTLGAGVVYDQELRGVGEFFWQPSAPLEISAAATTSSSSAWDYIGRVNYRPSPDFFLAGNIDQLSSSANASWRLGKNFTAISSYESLRSLAIGAEYFNSGFDHSTQLRADIDLQGRTRLAANQRWENWQASYLGNESANSLQLTYNLANSGRFDSGSELVLGYQASKQANSSSLTSALWRYRSPDRTADGRNLWQTELGYGFSGFGSGLLAIADLNFIPGLQLRTSYRGVSDNSNQGSYAIELTTTLFTGNGIRGTYDRVEDFRNLGKIVFQPFLDKNQNGRQDNGEESYWDPQLIRLNEKPIDRFRPQVNNNQGDINLPNGSYRIDIDPAGYPINYRSRLDALRADLVSGGVTTITIPLVQSYSMVGFVKDTKGDAVPGSRVEALNLRTKSKIISITNDAGFYTLEGLEQDEYKITVSDLATTPNNIKIVPSSQPQQEINLTITIPEQ